MPNCKKSKVTVTGIFRHDLAGVDLRTCKWVDIDGIAKEVGIDKNHMVKARITLEVIEEPCELCGKPATGHQVCQRCGKLVCDECARKYLARRYCPACFDKMNLHEKNDRQIRSPRR